jgi:hypothetical protein
MPATLLLSRDTWDLVLDAAGNIAVATEPYALAQDAASAIRLFLGEARYDTAQGVPYFEQVLGKYPSAEFMRSAFAAAALSVPGVASDTVYFDGLTHRTLTGQVQITDTNGVITAAGF